MPVNLQNWPSIGAVLPAKVKKKSLYYQSVRQLQKFAYEEYVCVNEFLKLVRICVYVEMRWVKTGIWASIERNDWQNWNLQIQILSRSYPKCVSVTHSRVKSGWHLSLLLQCYKVLQLSRCITTVSRTNFFGRRNVTLGVDVEKVFVHGVKPHR